jgi:iron complex transport system substrate-binding protein
LAPSLTETLFALGVGDRVVGVTRYCAHPPAVEGLPRVGGYLDPNYEAIVALEPDLVVLIPSSEASERRLLDLSVPVLSVDQHDVAAVLQSVTMLAEICGVGNRGAELRSSMEERLQAVRDTVSSAPTPRALVVVGHEIGAGTVRSVWAAGPDTFYDGMLEIAGAVNALDAAAIHYPELSREGLAALDPDVILDVVAGIDERGLEIEEIMSGWGALTELRAVRDGRVRVLEGDLMVVPGPRLPELVARIARALHPDREWEIR